MGAVDPYFEGVNPLFDTVSVHVLDTTTQSDSSEGSPIVELIDGKRSVGGVVFLGQPVEKHNRRISTLEQRRMAYAQEVPKKGVSFLIT